MTLDPAALDALFYPLLARTRSPHGLPLLTALSHERGFIEICGPGRAARFLSVEQCLLAARQALLQHHLAQQARNTTV